MTVKHTNDVAPNTDPTTAPAITLTGLVSPPLDVGLGAAVVEPAEVGVMDSIDNMEDEEDNVEGAEVKIRTDDAEGNVGDGSMLVVVALTGVGRA
jgi:hypothetical protein